MRFVEYLERFVNNLKSAEPLDFQRMFFEFLDVDRDGELSVLNLLFAYVKAPKGSLFSLEVRSMM